MRKRRNHEAGFNASVALEAVKGERTLSELATEYGVHPTMIHQWRRRFSTGRRTFSSGARRRPLRSTRTPFGRCTQRSESWPSPAIFLLRKPNTSGHDD